MKEFWVHVKTGKLEAVYLPVAQFKLLQLLTLGLLVIGLLNIGSLCMYISFWTGMPVNFSSVVVLFCSYTDQDVQPCILPPQVPLSPQNFSGSSPTPCPSYANLFSSPDTSLSLPEPNDYFLHVLSLLLMSV